MKQLHHAATLSWIAAVLLAMTTSGASADVTKYIRYESSGRASYGLLEGENRARAVGRAVGRKASQRARRELSGVKLWPGGAHK